MSKKYIIGIDEVGRGALAGPVAVCAAALPKNIKIKSKINPVRNFYSDKSARELFRAATNAPINRRKNVISNGIKLKDSKKLSLKQRIYWENWSRGKKSIIYSVSFVSNKTIDKINISNAANLAAWKSFMKVKNKLPAGGNFSVIIDGGLYLKNKVESLKAARTVVKADEKFNAVKLASIIAKLSRDRLMVKAAQIWPQYGFDVHKGYGTKQHLDAIQKHGKSVFHRLTFIQKKQ